MCVSLCGSLNAIAPIVSQAVWFCWNGYGLVGSVSLWGFEVSYAQDITQCLSLLPVIFKM